MRRDFEQDRREVRPVSPSGRSELGTAEGVVATPPSVRFEVTVADTIPAELLPHPTPCPTHNPAEGMTPVTRRGSSIPGPRPIPSPPATGGPTSRSTRVRRHTPCTASLRPGPPSTRGGVPAGRPVPACRSRTADGPGVCRRGSFVGSSSSPGYGDTLHPFTHSLPLLFRRSSCFFFF